MIKQGARCPVMTRKTVVQQKKTLNRDNNLSNRVLCFMLCRARQLLGRRAKKQNKNTNIKSDIFASAGRT